jgi:hypothetical protein
MRLPKKRVRAALAIYEQIRSDSPTVSGTVEALADAFTLDAIARGVITFVPDLPPEPPQPPPVAPQRREPPAPAWTPPPVPQPPSPVPPPPQENPNPWDNPTFEERPPGRSDT